MKIENVYSLPEKEYKVSNGNPVYIAMSLMGYGIKLDCMKSEEKKYRALAYYYARMLHIRITTRYIKGYLYIVNKS